MHEGHRKRLKNRCARQGFDSLEEHEALELLLYYSIPRKDTNETAHRLLARFGSFAAVLDADAEELKKVESVGEHTAAFLKLLPAAGNYYAKSRYREKPYLRNATEAGKYMAAMIGERTNEVFAAACLDAQRRVIEFCVIEQGTVSETSVSPRKVAETLIRYNTVSVIFAHNHPSGTLHPSEEDLSLTRKLCDMLESMGINVIDHIIVGQQQFTSMSERGLMPN